MNKADKISLVSFIVLSGFIFGVVSCYFAQYLGLEYPFTSFLFNPKIAFQDFTNLLPLVATGTPYTPPATWQQYLPLAYAILFPFALIQNPLIAYVGFFGMFLSYFCFKNCKVFYCHEFSKIVNIQNILILTLTSYPFLCLFDRGNFDLILFIFFSIFATQLYKKKYVQSAIFLGILNAFKPFSIPFLLLFLAQKRFKEFFISILTSIVLILGGFLLFDKNVLSQFIVMLQSWKFFSFLYVDDYSNYGLINSASIFPILKLKFCYFTKLLTTQQLGYWYNILSLCATIATIFLALKEKVFWKQLMLITLYMLLIPISVYDYKLIFLFVPLYFFVNEKQPSKFDKIYTILFGLLLIPKHYWIVPLDELNRLSISTWLTPFLMIVFAILIIWEMLRFRAK